MASRTRPPLARAAALAAALLLAASVAGALPGEDATAKAVRSVLDRSAAEGADLDALRAELAMLGAPALPALFAALPELADDFRHPGSYELAVDTFGRLPPADLRAFLRSVAGADAPPTAVVQALRILTATGGGESLDLVMELGARLGENPLAVASTRGLVVAAYGGIVGRSPPANLPLTGVWNALPGEWREALLDAIEQQGGPGAVEMLVQVAAGGRGGEAALSRIVRMPVLGMERTDRSITDAVLRLLLGGGDPSTRVLAAQAAARLHLPLCFRGIVVLLEDEAAQVVRAAQQALEELSGVRLPCDPARWDEWFEKELQWVAEGMATDLAALRSSEDAAVIELLGRLGYHRLYRADFARDVVRTAENGSPEVRRAAFATLARLRSPEAIPFLLGALDSSDEERALASSGLAAITRLRAPGKPAGWKTLLSAPPSRQPAAAATGAR